MKRAVSISLGSSKRDKSIQLEWLGEQILLERIGTDGDFKKAQELFSHYDGKVDAFGLGGADLALTLEAKTYPIHSVKKLVSQVRKTPITDGSGLKSTLEKEAVRLVFPADRKVFITLACDRWGMASSFLDNGFEVVFGDLMFALGFNFPIKSVSLYKRICQFLLPIATRLPFKMVYPIGQSQEKTIPKFEKWYQWASIISGDCHYIKRHMPQNLENKIIVTNTTTQNDRELFQKRGVKCLITTTPIIHNRSFGTNALEAALIAFSGKKEVLTQNELETLIQKLQIKPSILEF